MHSGKRPWVLRFSSQPTWIQLTITIGFALAVPFGSRYLISHLLDLSIDTETFIVFCISALSCIVVYLLARRSMHRLIPNNCTLEQAVEEHAAQILQDAAVSPAVADSVQAEADEIERLLTSRGQEVSRRTLTLALNAILDGVTDPGWSGPSTPLGYSAVRMRIAGICHLARARGFLRARVP